jgi:ComF family protein
MPSVQSWISDFVHLFYPHVCTGCGSDILDHNHQLCLRCLSGLPVTHFFSQPANPVEKKFYGRLPLRNGGAAYFFTKDSLLQSIIYELKYNGNQEIGHYLGKLVGKQLFDSGRFSQIDALVPLPLNKRKEKKRGYNQATALCLGIASVWEKAVINNAVIRNVNTDTQTHRGRITRWENMEGVFSVVDASAIQNKHILLVDDVVTTGASLEACGAEILRVPGVTLSIATLAYTV